MGKNTTGSASPPCLDTDGLWSLLRCRSFVVCSLVDLVQLRWYFWLCCGKAFKRTNSTLGCSLTLHCDRYHWFQVLLGHRSLVRSMPKRKRPKFGRRTHVFPI